jgi:YggT family protein
MIISLLYPLVDVYTLIIFVYVMMSWIPMKRGLLADIEHALGVLCEPFLGIFRKYIPPIGGMVDVSPVVAIIALQLIMRIIVWLF